MNKIKNWSHGERLYHLLPAIHRIRDTAEGEPLRALMALVEAELEAVERNIEDLHENSFIETCDEWAIPYIADLLGVRGLHSIASAGSFSQRAYVANTLRYRRRKGTASVLEQLARDVTGWPARVVEFFQLLGTTQHMNHIRLQNVRTPDLRDGNALELLGTPFEAIPHSAEVRHIASAHGRYNIPSLGLFLWRLQSYAVTRGRAHLAGTLAQGRYTFDPVGLDTPLFNRPQTETEITHLAEEINVPGRLRRRSLHEDLRRVRQNDERSPVGYFAASPVLQLFVDAQFDTGNQPVAVPLEEILICDLSDWRRPPGSISITRRRQQPDGVYVDENIVQPISAGVDPQLGRIAFPAGKEPNQLHVSYAYGFSSDIGGGPYDRRNALNDTLSRAVAWQVGVTRNPTVTPASGELLFSTLTEAVQAWNARPAGEVGVIAIMDSDSYIENLTGAGASIHMQAGSQLHIVSADWPLVDIPGSINQKQRVNGQLSPRNLRPHVRGRVSVRGTASADEDGGELVLNGLLIEGGVRVLAGRLGNLSLDHCTLVPGIGDLQVNPSANPGLGNDRLHVLVRNSIVGGIVLPESVPELVIADSIIDRPGDLAIAAPGNRVTIERSTLLGASQMRQLDASEVLFTQMVSVERRQLGCVRFSYVVEGSRTPRRYRCQPDLALKGVDNEAETTHILARLRPSFTSEAYGNPAYAQLGRQCPQEIKTGGEDGAEMGVYYNLKQTQRISNLETALNEYLPFGLEAGILFIT